MSNMVSINTSPARLAVALVSCAQLNQKERCYLGDEGRVVHFLVFGCLVGQTRVSVGTSAQGEQSP